MIINKIEKNKETWFLKSEDNKFQILPFHKNMFLWFKDVNGKFNQYVLKRTSIYFWKLNKTKQFDFLYLNLYLNEITFLNLFKNAKEVIKEINLILKNNKDLSQNKIKEELKILLKKHFKENISEESSEENCWTLTELEDSINLFEKEELPQNKTIPIIEDKKTKKLLLSDLREFYEKEVKEVNKVWISYKPEELINEKVKQFYKLYLDKNWTYWGNELKEVSQINLKNIKDECDKEFIERFLKVDFYSYNNEESIQNFMHQFIEFATEDVLFHKYLTKDDWTPYDSESIKKNSKEILEYWEIDKIFGSYKRSKLGLFFDLHWYYDERDYFSQENKKLNSRSNRRMMYLFSNIEDESDLFLLWEKQSEKGLIYKSLINDFLNNWKSSYTNFEDFFNKHSNNEIKLYTNKISSLLKRNWIKNNKFKQEEASSPDAPFLILTNNTQRILSRLNSNQVLIFLKNVFEKIKESKENQCLLLLDYNHINSFDINFYSYLSFMGWMSILWNAHLMDIKMSDWYENGSIFDYIHPLNIFHLIESYLEYLDYFYYLPSINKNSSFVDSIKKNYWDSNEKKYNFLVLFICYHLRKEKVLNLIRFAKSNLKLLETDTLFSIVMKAIFKNYNKDFDNLNINNWSYQKLIETCLALENPDINKIYNLFIISNLNGEENFILNIDTETTLCINQQRNRIWNETYYDPLLYYLRRKREIPNIRKSELFKDLYEDGDYNDIENNKLITSLSKDKQVLKNIMDNYLNKIEIYETSRYLGLEYDGIREILSMGVAPQASCQNITKDTGYNHKILATTLLPYTKLLLFFEKPYNSWELLGLDLDKKEFIFKFWNYNLKASWRCLLILDWNGKNIVDVKRLYGSWFKNDEEIKSFYSKETFNNLQEYLTNKYSVFKDKNIKEYYREDEENYGRDFIYVD